jgi:hypothetical protein
MNYSRRKFMKAGALAAACAGLPLKSALAQSWSKVTPGSPLPASIQQLGYYSKSAFTPYVNTKFRVYLGPSNTRGLRLIEVSDYPTSLAQVEATANSIEAECFSLLFTIPPGKPFSQDTYMIEHEALGTFYMFLVSVNAHSKKSTDYYEAVIYRRQQYSGNETAIVTETEQTVTGVPSQPARNPWRVSTPKGERDVFAFRTLLVSSSAATEQANEKSAPVQATWLTMAQDRGISGIKLGMTVEQVLALFPGSERDEEIRSSLSRPSQFGVSSLTIRPQKYSSKAEFEGINQILMTLLDDHVSTLYVGYDAPAPEAIDELVTKFSKGRKLPPARNWEAYVGLDDQLKTMKCKDFEISVFAGGQNLNINYVQMLDTVAQQKLKQRRAEAKKKGMNKPKQ